MIDIILADAHLKRYSLRREIEGDSFYSFEQIITYAITNKVNAIHILGDNFDVNLPSSDVINFFRKQIDRLPKNIKIYAIEGQHDRATPPWFKAIADDRIIHASKDPTYSVSGHKAIAFDQAPKEIIREQLANIPPDTEILCLHQWFKEAIEINWNVTEEDIPEFVKVVLCGDFHQPLDWLNKNKTRILYTGSTCLQKINELDNKSFITIDDQFKIERIPLKTRPIWRSVVSDAEQFTEWLEEVKDKKKILLAQSKGLPAELQKPIVYIKFSDKISNALEQIKIEVGSWAHLYTNIIVTNYETKEIGLEDSLDIVECLDELVDKEKDKDYYKFVLDLISTDNSKAYLNDFKAKLLKI